MEDGNEIRVEFDEKHLIVRTGSEKDAHRLWDLGFFGSCPMDRKFAESHHQPQPSTILTDMEVEVDGIAESKTDKFMFVVAWEEAIYLVSRKCLRVFDLVNTRSEVTLEYLWKRFSLAALDVSYGLLIHSYPDRYKSMKSFISHLTHPSASTNGKLAIADYKLVAELISNTFITRYVAYEHLRRHGWIIRDGMKFGSDFMLYLEGPNLDHSLFGCSVRVKINNSAACNKIPLDLTWNKIQTKLRLLNNVMKESTICILEVDLPFDLEECMQIVYSIYTEPSAALHLFKVRKYDVKRWSAEKCRTPNNATAAIQQ